MQKKYDYFSNSVAIVVVVALGDDWDVPGEIFMVACSHTFMFGGLILPGQFFVEVRGCPGARVEFLGVAYKFTKQNN